jgi:hypothetical protein
MMITSAQAGDGKSVTAFGLAESLAKAGHHTALVVDRAAVRTPEEMGVEFDAGKRLSIVSIPKELSTGSPSREALGAYFDRLRSKNAYTIIDAEPLLRSSVAMQLASIVDGVLMSVRIGRAATEYDELMVRALKRAKANVFGAIAVSEDSIADFMSLRGTRKETDTRVVTLDPSYAHDTGTDARVHGLLFEHA